MGLPERDALLARLLDEVEQTKALFEGAKAEFDRGTELAKALGPNHPDGMLGHAARAYSITLTNYRLALWRFNRFVLDGKLPDGEAPTDS